ncbi:ABC transporter permease [Amycolatopsis sp. YIM 10]|uniref:ABC transporter permease n=1 Tax=Amycolatopsis sp. YIM 10 TaxID=2653857 RepID=UPI00128FE956|nr:ABC transporter permease [Amycolatopsis sp. YIM 10]QFU89534.1 Glutathione transport system permease protein GsiD [Amycolatopsis sp. YIM 10]
MTATIDPVRATEAPPPGRRRRFRTARMLLSERRTRVVLVLLIVLVLAAALGPLLMPYGQNEQDLTNRLQTPGGGHLLGTDSLGRDILTLVFAGTRLSLLAGLLAVGTAVVLGVPAGLLAGYRGGAFGAISNTVSDTLLSLPPLILALAIVGAYGGGVVPAMLAVGVTLAPRFYRVTRGVGASVSKDSFVEAARSIGCTTPRILGRHVFANAVAPILVQVTFSIGLAIIAEASLSFLGLGAQPPAVSLGTMARDAFTHIRELAFPIFPPCTVIAVIVFLFSSLGDGLRDAIVSGGRRS